MIDIIIPAYNAHNTIFNTLSSIAIQNTLNLINVYIIDDNSEISYQYYVDFFSDYFNIFLIKNTKNKGPGYCRQLGIKKSNSKYIVFLDSDDILCNPFSIQKLLLNIDNSKYDLVVGAFLEELKDKSFITYYYDTMFLHGKIFSREFLEKNGIKFENKYNNEDTGFIKNIIIHNGNIKYIDEKVYIWKYNKNSITRNVKNEYYKNGLVYFMDIILKTLNRGIKDHCSMEKISFIVYDALVYSYFYYLVELNNDVILPVDDIKKIISLEKKYNKISEEERYNVYNNVKRSFKKYYYDTIFDDHLLITFNDFKEMINGVMI